VIAVEGAGAEGQHQQGSEQEREDSRTWQREPAQEEIPAVSRSS
jgi:hypothetical protein